MTEVHKHVMEPVENNGGRVIAHRCTQCGVVVDLHGKRMVAMAAHVNPWQLEQVKCVECSREYSCALVYVHRRKYCRKQCRWKAAYSRRKNKHAVSDRTGANP